MLNKIIKKISSHRIKPEGKDRKTSVLLALVPVNGEYHILFEKRSLEMNTQPGEICLPGGKNEDGESPEISAIRETMEELNIKEDSIEIFGEIDPIITPFNLIIYPFVGTVKISDIKSIDFNPAEVDHVFTVPVSFFMQHDPTIYYVGNSMDFPDGFPFEKIPGGRDYPWRKGQYKISFYEYDDYLIWGITARIVNNFINIIKGLSD
jgi:8-oxo-dGTP pyrophosphatase MutT (NUDIX family)